MIAGQGSGNATSNPCQISPQLLALLCLHWHPHRSKSCPAAMDMQADEAQRHQCYQRVHRAESTASTGEKVRGCIRHSNPHYALEQKFNMSLLVYRLVNAPVTLADRAKAGFDSPTESFFFIFPPITIAYNFGIKCHSASKCISLLAFIKEHSNASQISIHLPLGFELMTAS